VIPQGPIAGHESPAGAQGLAQGAHEKGNTPLHPLGLRQTGAGGSQQPASMGLIHQQQSLVALAEGDESRQVGGIPIHAEDGVREHQRRARGLGPPSLELALKVIEIAVAEDAQVGALGLGHAAAVHQGGVVEGIGEDRIPGLHQGGHDRGVALEPGIEEQTSLGALPFRQGAFQIVVQGGGAPEETGGPGARAEAPGGPGGGLAQPGIPAQAQVVVGREVEPEGLEDGSLAAQLTAGLRSCFQSQSPGSREGRGSHGEPSGRGRHWSQDQSAPAPTGRATGTRMVG